MIPPEDKKIRHWLIIGSLILIALFIRISLAPLVLKIPPTFHYSADIISLDNFFDEQLNTFKGEKRSVTSFDYSVIPEKSNYLHIRNSINVRAVGGDPIFNTHRDYWIDPITSQQMEIAENNNRSGYLFAPRHLKPKTTFTYWHVNYNAPAHLSFVAKENLLGLTTYHYRSTYQGQHIDQSNELTFLPGVPETQGIELEPVLDVWFEPVSGYLVMYKDTAWAYFYDQHTKKRLHPWNHFLNTYTQQSIIQHVRQAQLEKIKVILAEELVPGLFLGSAFLYLILAYRPKKFFAALAVSTLTITCYVLISIACFLPKKIITIGIAQWTNTTEHNMLIQGFKKSIEEAGYQSSDIRYILENAETDETIQSQQINTFIHQKSDLILTLTTPGTRVAQKITTSTPVVFSLVPFPVEMQLVNNLQNSGNNLVGTRLWTLPEKQVNTITSLIPSVTTVGFIQRYHQPTTTALTQFTQAAQDVQIRTQEISATSVPELITSITEKQNLVDALYVSCDSLMQDGGEEITISLGEKFHKPVFSCLHSGIEHGALAGYVSDMYELGKITGTKAALILQGVPPSAIETSSAVRPFLFVNKRRADELGISIPAKFFVHVQQVIN
jgi:putative ABC transport system substrate-binding protein